jgi:hypothetical protein
VAERVGLGGVGEEEMERVKEGRVEKKERRQRRKRGRECREVEEGEEVCMVVRGEGRGDWEERSVVEPRDLLGMMEEMHQRVDSLRQQQQHSHSLGGWMVKKVKVL